MTSTCVDPIGDPGWLALVSRHGAGLFHSPPWLAAVRDTYGFAIRATLVIDENGKPRSGIPYAVLEGLPAGRVVAAPFCDSCNPLLGAQEDFGELLATLRRHGLPVLMRCIDSDLPSAFGFVVTKRARWHVVDVLEKTEDRWQALDSSNRRAIQKARRMGVSVRPLEPGTDLAAFHHLHVKVRKSKYGMLAQPLLFFETIAHHFQASGSWHALGAWIGERLVGATIYLRWGDTLYCKFNASSLDDLEARPNTLLTWEGIELAKHLGCRKLDLGPSDDDQPGLIRYKRQFGAREQELCFFGSAPHDWDDTPGIRSRRLFSELTQLLTRRDVPDSVTADAGKMLYGYFA